jgi:hypothetical protein
MSDVVFLLHGGLARLASTVTAELRYRKPEEDTQQTSGFVTVFTLGPNRKLRGSRWKSEHLVLRSVPSDLGYGVRTIVAQDWLRTGSVVWHA